MGLGVEGPGCRGGVAGGKESRLPSLGLIEFSGTV